MTTNTPNLRTEVLAGLSTFLAAFYIIIVNPAILSDAGMPFGAVVTATVLVAGFGSLMMGLYAKNPIVVAPGMGINAFFTYSLSTGISFGFISWTVLKLLSGNRKEINPILAIITVFSLFFLWI
ncbi:solute carrier family 23 protein [Cyclobacterium salsum]|uniref:solute carrier family 23 protein n=1 Tax=Cyclobacterium salsum TaxID=2666329 RepID=UPI001390C19C|nr:solute carrier family 23 protein [Cyclobacterium salsum]